VKKRVERRWTERPNRTGAPRSPQRTRISCYAASDRTACAAFFKESRIEFDNAINLDRKIRGTWEGNEIFPLLSLDGSAAITAPSKSFISSPTLPRRCSKSDCWGFPRISCGDGGSRNFMRLSLQKAAHANTDGAACRKSGSPRLFRPTYAGANVGHPSGFATGICAND
jgi:hypothetical protein